MARTPSTGAYLLRGQIPLRLDEMVFALDEHWNVVLLHDERFVTQRDQLQVDGVRFVCTGQTTEKMTLIFLCQG